MGRDAKRGAPANMAAIAKFVNPVSTGIYTGGPTRYADPITLSIDAGDATGFPRIRYSIPSASMGAKIDLGLYDMSGALVRTLVHEPARRGDFSVPFAKPGAAGAYMVRLSSGKTSLTARAVLAQ